MMKIMAKLTNLVFITLPLLLNLGEKLLLSGGMKLSTQYVKIGDTSSLDNVGTRARAMQLGVK